jgi:hypothetical protein
MQWNEQVLCSEQLNSDCRAKSSKLEFGVSHDDLIMRAAQEIPQ